MSEDFVEAVQARRPAATAPMSSSTWSAATISSATWRPPRVDGRIVQIAFLKGAKVEIDLMRLMLRRLTLTGSTLRVQSADAKQRMARASRSSIWPLIAAGKLKPVIDSTFKLDDASGAHRRIDDPEHVGKIMLVVK